VTFLQVSLEDSSDDIPAKLDPITAVYTALREWADAHFSTEVSYERALSLIVSKGYPKEVRCLRVVSSLFSNTRQMQVLDACLEEYSSLDVLVLDGDNNILFVE